MEGWEGIRDNKIIKCELHIKEEISYKEELYSKLEFKTLEVKCHHFLMKRDTKVIHHD